MDERPPKQLTTPELIAKLDELEVARKKERHENNSRVMGAIMMQGHEAEKTNDRIGSLEGVVQTIAADLKHFTDSVSPLVLSIKTRLTGDSEMKVGGLISEHDKMKEDVAEIKKDVRDTKREQRIALAVLSGAAAVIYFLQKTGAINFLEHKP